MCACEGASVRHAESGRRPGVVSHLAQVHDDEVRLVVICGRPAVARSREAVDDARRVAIGDRGVGRDRATERQISLSRS
jgi:hypothetical protein